MGLRSGRQLGAASLPVLTLTSNFVDIYGHCIVGGWYLSTDVQLLLAGAPLLILLARACSEQPPPTKQNNNISATETREIPPDNNNNGSTERTADATTKEAPPSCEETNKNGCELEMMDFRRQLQQAAAHDNKRAHRMDASEWRQHNIHVVVDNNRNRNRNRNRNMTTPTRRLMAAYACVALTAAGSALISIVCVALYSRSDFSSIIKFLPHTMAVLSDNIQLYTNPVFRFRASALGLLLGHWLHLYELRLVGLPRWLAGRRCWRPARCSCSGPACGRAASCSSRTTP